MDIVLLRLAGAGQLLVALASLGIPHVLRWRENTRSLEPLTRTIFWTYAGYIFASNVAFGLLSLVRPSWLLEGSGLARTVSAFIAIWWATRAILQVTWYSRHRPSGRKYALAEALFLTIFAFLGTVYARIAVTGG